MKIKIKNIQSLNINQIIDGIGNEISVVLFFFTAVLCLVVPLYVLRPQRPQRNNTSEVSERNIEQDTNSQTENNTESNTENNSPNQQPVDESRNESHSSYEQGCNMMINIKVKHNETTQQHTVSSSILIKDLKQ